MKGSPFVFAVALSSRPLLAGILLLFLVRRRVERVPRMGRVRRVLALGRAPVLAPAGGELIDPIAEVLSAAG